jgi:hypothetical protein
MDFNGGNWDGHLMVMESFNGSVNGQWQGNEGKKRCNNQIDVTEYNGGDGQ